MDMMLCVSKFHSKIFKSVRRSSIVHRRFSLVAQKVRSLISEDKSSGRVRREQRLWLSALPKKKLGFPNQHLRSVSQVGRPHLYISRRRGLCTVISALSRTPRRTQLIFVRGAKKRPCFLFCQYSSSPHSFQQLQLSVTNNMASNALPRRIVKVRLD